MRAAFAPGATHAGPCRRSRPRHADCINGSGYRHASHFFSAALRGRGCSAEVTCPADNLCIASRGESVAAVVESVNAPVAGSESHKRIRFGSVEPALLAALKQLDPMVAVLTLFACEYLARV